MKNQELFDKTIQVLVSAYLNDTLANTTCCACAVGNMLLACNGTKPIRDEHGDLGWPHEIVLFSPGGTSWYEVVRGQVIASEGLNQINKTGYSWHELSLIESAFERPNSITYNKSREERIQISLMSVVDCLMKIHQADLEEAEEAKSLFVKVR